jgi:hypothetical protein
MKHMKTTYKIIESPPYDKGAPNTFWIKKETKLLGFTIYSRTIGDYRMYDGFGELGDCPFFSEISAKRRLKILNKTN